MEGDRGTGDRRQSQVAGAQQRTKGDTLPKISALLCNRGAHTTWYRTKSEEKSDAQARAAASMSINARRTPSPVACSLGKPMRSASR
jgi:hypothetical protein